MARRAVHTTSRSVALRGSFLAVLAAVSVPALAASGISQSCEEGAARPAERSPLSAEPAGDHEALVVLKAEGKSSGIDPSRDLGTMLGDDYDEERGSIAVPRQKAVAEALERRRNGRFSATTNEDELAELPPSIDTALPGIGDAESLIYRREMYRTDI